MLVVKRLILSLFLLMSPQLFAADLSSSIEPNWGEMLMWLLGGLALFLFGLERLIKSLLIVAGDKVKFWLARLTVNRFTGAMTGAAATAVIQSSSVTSVLAIGFVSAGLMTAAQAASVIMGANLGTTITAQIVAFKVTHYALAMILIGFSIQFFAKNRKKIALGDLILALGLIFLGMNTMSEGMAPLREYAPFLDLMMRMQTPLYGILVGMVFTALVQSSSATIAIVIVMASQGLLTLPAGIALAMGANIGTTITALLATIGKSREALRTALIHVQFNVLAVLIWLPFIPYLAEFSVWISAHESIANGSMQQLAENTPREIANANTLFNFVSLLLFLPLIPLFLRIVHWLVPLQKEEKTQGEFKPEFLDKTLLSHPGLAMQAVNYELELYQKQLNLFYRRAVVLIAKPNLNGISKEDLISQRLQAYQRKILKYLAEIGQSELTEEEHDEFIRLMNVINQLESILSVMQNNILSVIHDLIEHDIQPSETMVQLVGRFTTEVGRSIENALGSIYQSQDDLALEVISIKPTIDALMQEALEHQAHYFQPSERRLRIFRYEMQLVDGFKQLHTLAKRIARIQLQPKETKEE